MIYENGGREVLRYEEVPDPECPEGCVVVDPTRSASRERSPRPRERPAARSPTHRGYASAGAVSEVAAHVPGRAVGERVVALDAAGSHAAKRAVPAAMTWPIPDGLDAARAACVPVTFGWRS